MSPNAYEVARVTAAAPISEASSSTSANSAPACWPSVCARPAATPPASVKWPCSAVPANPNAVTAIIAAAPMTTTNEPITVSARS